MESSLHVGTALLTCVMRAGAADAAGGGAAAGTRFDIASPKEVRRVLWEHLKLEVPPCAIKRGHLSTADDVSDHLFLVWEASSQQAGCCPGF